MWWIYTTIYQNLGSLPLMNFSLRKIRVVSSHVIEYDLNIAIMNMLQQIRDHEEVWKHPRAHYVILCVLKLFLVLHICILQCNAYCFLVVNVLIQYESKNKTQNQLMLNFICPLHNPFVKSGVVEPNHTYQVGEVVCDLEPFDKLFCQKVGCLPSIETIDEMCMQCQADILCVALHSLNQQT